MLHAIAYNIKLYQLPSESRYTFKQLFYTFKIEL